MEVSGGPIRVLFIDHESRLSGGEQDLLDLVRALGPRVEAHVALPEEGPLSRALAETSAVVHLVPMSQGMRSLSRWELGRRPAAAIPVLFESVRYAWKLGMLIAHLRPTFVHTNSMKAHLVGAVSARYLGIPLIWHVRDILGSGWLRRAFAFAGGHLPMRIICISEAVRAQFIGTAAEGRAVVIYNGIDLARFAGSTGESFRRDQGIPLTARLVGMVGQIAHWKGQDTFIEAARTVNQTHPDAYFIVVGECLFPENEADYEASLHEAVDAHGLGGVVRFAGWQNDPAEVMSALDVVVHASRLPEPFGRVIIEGSAAGAAVVASTAGAGPELIKGPAGRLVEPGNPQLLADAIMGSLEADRVAIGAAAKASASRFDISLTADAVQGLYRELSVPA